MADTTLISDMYVALAGKAAPRQIIEIHKKCVNQIKGRGGDK